MQKNIQNNHVNPWNPSNKKPHHTRWSNRIENRRSMIKQSCATSKQKHTCSSATVFTPSGSINHCFVEDFIQLQDGSALTILLPLKEYEISKNVVPTFDTKFLKLIDIFQFEITQVGDTNNLCYVINAIILSSPNRDHALSGIDKVSLKEGLNGNKKYGSIVSVNDNCSIHPLIKWNDVLNGRRNRMMIFTKLDNLRIPTSTFFNYRSNEDVLLRLLSMLFEEAFGDSLQYQFLIIAYYQAQKNKNKTKSTNSLKT